MSRYFLHLRMSSGGGGKITPHLYLEFCGTYAKNFNSYTHVFEVKLINGANSYVTGSWYVTGNRYGVSQTGNSNISCYRTARKIIQTIFFTLSRVRYTVV